MVKNNGGRPTKLTEAVSRMIYDGVARGLTFKAACRCAGVSYSALAGWMAKGRRASQQGAENNYSKLENLLQTKVHESRWANYRAFSLECLGRDFRRGWKNPMKYSTRQKLREKALQREEELRKRSGW